MTELSLSINAVNPNDEQNSFTSNSMSIRDEFFKWLSDSKISQYSPEVILPCMDKFSEYAINKKVTAVSFWDITQHIAFKPIYQKLLKKKLLRKTDKSSYRVFIAAGQLYMRFLKEKAFVCKDTVIEKTTIDYKHSQNNIIDPENVIAWLATQPNANGTLYLENVARQYMGVLRTAPAKLDIPVNLDVRNVFLCRDRKSVV
jgi:hypothetical protein